MVGDAKRRQYGWAGTVKDFLGTPAEQLLSPLEEHLFGLLKLHAAATQVSAWTEEVAILHMALRDAARVRMDLLGWGIVFEYELLLEGGRRPDVVLITGSDVVSIEFKSTGHINVADVDQSAAYARDLAEYHSGTHDLNVHALLVPTTLKSPSTSIDGVEVIKPNDLTDFLLRLPGSEIVDVDAWVNSAYEPIPSLIQAARLIFQEQGLPRIRRCWSSGVPEAVELLGQIADECSQDSGRALSFLAGVPGAGKTLAGLQLVYERTAVHGLAVFLSGNVPLVEVLRGALQSKTFVKDLHAFIKTFSKTHQVPSMNVIVFDEAQRAWDRKYMMFKNGVDASEPDLLVRIGEDIPDWCALVGLVGDGQEIHAGEEAGIGQWATAIKTQGKLDWRIYCPPRMGHHFRGLDVREDARLDLSVTLRSKRAEHLHEWVAEVLSGNLRSAARTAVDIRGNAFPLYLTRNLAEAKSYVLSRYEGDFAARYGILASSRTQSFLPKYAVDSSYPATKKVKFANWYNNGPGEIGSGCNFEEVVTEFGCQGLELDMPLIAWGNDLKWNGSEWQAKPRRGGYQLDNAEQLRLNAYRVLLTRGRDGLVIFIPETPEMDETEMALLAAGVQPLPVKLAVAS